MRSTAVSNRNTNLGCGTLTLTVVENAEFMQDLITEMKYIFRASALME